MKEHDIVETTEDYDDIPQGTVGTIVYVYDNLNFFEVEFPLLQKITMLARRHLKLRS